MKSQVYNQPNTSSKRAHKSENNQFFNKISSAKSFILFFFFIFTAISFSQPVTKVLISGSNGAAAHDLNVKSAFLLGYSSYDGSQFPGQIDLVSYAVYYSLQYADQNGYQVIIRSTTGLNTTVNDSAKNHPKVMLFMPAGSNSFVNVCNISIPTSAVVSTGAGVDGLATGYKVEFFSIDPITTSNASSFSNGYIAGQIAFLANHFNITLQQAREIARYNATLGTSTTSCVQYGKINLTEAVSNGASEYTILGSFTNSFYKNVVTLNWTTSQEFNLKGWDIERANLSKKTDIGNLQWAAVGFVNARGTSSVAQGYVFNNKATFNGEIMYRLKQYSLDGTYTYSDAMLVNTAVKTSVENDGLAYNTQSANADNAISASNYPNPFNPSTMIHFELPKAAKVNLSVYNILGQKVVTLVDEFLNAGSYDKTFSTSMADGQLASGMYLYVLQLNDEVALSRKMILMK